MGLLDLIGHKYPFTDFHELNLDWCITAILQLQKAFEDFSAGNKLIFANPLQHDLTKTYAKNTIVDSVSGTAYLSLAAVPVGVQLDNADYWLPVFDFASYVTRANKNFTDNYFSGTDRTPIALAVGDWVVLDDVLYKVAVAMAADDLFIIGTNIVHFTVEQFLKDFITTVNQTLYNYSLTIQQYKNDIDASELAYRQQLAQDIANTTASLQAQLNLAISGATVDSEVINARAGWDSTAYPTLGDAIRTQIKNVINSIRAKKVDNLIQGQTIVNYPILNGHEYFVEMVGDGSYALASSEDDGTVITTYTSSTSMHRYFTFTASEDASYLRIYTNTTADYMYICELGNYDTFINDDIVHRAGMPDFEMLYDVADRVEKYVQYEITAGKTYRVKTGASIVAISSRTIDGTEIESYGNIPANSEVDITPTYDANYLRFYSLGDQTISIVPIGKIYNMMDLLGDTSMYNKQLSCNSGANYFAYPITAGNYYKVVSGVSATSVQSCDSGGTIIEEFAHAIQANTELVFKATLNATHLRLYSTSSQTVLITDLNHIIPLTLNDEFKKAEAPASGYENFSVSVNYANQVEDGDCNVTLYTDYGVIALPKNYSPQGEPTKLIIHCGGTGERIGTSTNPLTFWGWQYYLDKGFAVMDMNGISAAWGTSRSYPEIDKHYCSRYLIGSYTKGYDYVMKKYNLDPHVYLSGISMGGGAAALIAYSGCIPIRSCALFCPALSVFKQDYMQPWNGTDQQITIAGQAFFPNWNSTTPSQSYFLTNYEKIIGFDNLFINTHGDSNDIDDALQNYNDAAETAAFGKLQKSFPVPIKIWHCEDDTTVAIRYSKFMIEMIRRGGGMAFIHTFATGGHIGGWNNGSVNDVDIFANSITTSRPFYEAMQFFNTFG